MLEGIKVTGSAEYGRNIKMLVAGPAGSGKTLISSTFPDVFFASCEGGLMSLADRGIPYIDIKNIQQMFKLAGALSQPTDVRRELFGRDVKSIVIDTIDEVQRVMIRERLRETKKEGLEPRDWGWIGSQMALLISRFRDLDMNVVMTVHVKQDKDEQSGRIYSEPALQGQTGREIANYFDLALLLSAKSRAVAVGDKTERKIFRLLQTLPDDNHIWIKDRSGKLPSEVAVNFTDDYQRLHDYIYGDLVAPTAASAEEIVGESPTSVDGSLTVTTPPETFDITPDAAPEEDASVVVEETVNQVEPEKVPPVLGATDDMGEHTCDDCGETFEVRDKIGLAKLQMGFVKYRNKTLCPADYDKRSQPRKRAAANA